MQTLEHIAQRLASAARTVMQLAEQELVPFTATGARGHFPYFWQHPATLQMNALTYDWINSSLVAGTSPVMFGDAFTTLYTEALGSVSFRLSSHDQQLLAAAQGKTLAEQLAVLNAWQSAFGSIPAPTQLQTPLDIAMQRIVTEWASPQTNLIALQQAANPSLLLNRVPAGGRFVVEAVEAYLAVIGETVPLLNAVTMNSGRLHAARRAVQTPSAANGAIVTNDGVVHPAYAIATPVAQILQELDDVTRATTLQLEVTRESVSVNGSEPFSMRLEELVSIEMAAVTNAVTYIPIFGAESFLTSMIRPGETARIELAFNGMARVSFGPVPFDLETGNWYWIDPIVEALRNKAKDVTGFFFSPMPLIDFGTSGPFAFLTEVVISKLPVITLSQIGSTVEVIRQLELAGIPLYLDVTLFGASLRLYAATALTTGEVQLSPAAHGLDARGFVHLVAPHYPAAR